MAKDIDKSKPHDCFVAFLDIMGFKDRLQRDGHEKTMDMFKKLRPTLRELEEEAKVKEAKAKEDKTKRRRTFLDSYLDSNIDSDLNRKNISDSYIFPVTFSDSIILISNNATYECARAMLLRVYLILNIALDNEIPMKGAIAYGKMTVDTKEYLYFGQPLIDAVELQKELKLYGVVLHHTFEKRLNDPDFIKGHSLKELSDEYIAKYAVPMKSGKITHYIVDWTYLTDLFGDTIGTVTKLYNSVSGEPRIYVDNTLDFVHEMQKRGTEFLANRTKKKPV